MWENPMSQNHMAHMFEDNKKQKYTIKLQQWNCLMYFSLLDKETETEQWLTHVWDEIEAN